MLSKRTATWLIPLLAIVSFPLWSRPLGAFLQPRGGFDPNFRSHEENTRNFAMKDVVIMQNQDGDTTAVIRAEQAQTSTTPGEFVLFSVDSDLFDERGERVNVIADTGRYNTQQRQLILIDNVRVDRTADNQQLYSNLLYYYDESRTIHSPGDVRLVGEHIDIRGETLDYDIATNRYRIGGRVYCTIAGFNGT